MKRGAQNGLCVKFKPKQRRRGFNTDTNRTQGRHWRTIIRPPINRAGGYASHIASRLIALTHSEWPFLQIVIKGTAPLDRIKIFVNKPLAIRNKKRRADARIAEFN